MPKTQLRPDDNILTLQEVAELTKYDLKYLTNNYMRLFSEQGLHILKIAPNARPRFFRSEILDLMMRQK